MSMLFSLALLAAPVAGQILDEQGRPVPGAYVRSQNGSYSAFTDGQGRFRLNDGSGPFLVEAPGFRTVVIDQPEHVVLQRLTTFVPTPEIQAKAPELSSALSLFPTGIAARYGLERRDENASGATISGLANNVFGAVVRFKQGAWLVEADVSHLETPVNLATLPDRQNPAFRPDIWSLGVHGGWAAWQTPSWVVIPEVAFKALWSDPKNNGTPFTGTPLDVSQGRYGLGARLAGGWRWAEVLDVTAAAGLYPLVMTGASKGTPLPVSGGWELGGSVGRELFPGLTFALGYRHEGWWGNAYGDSQHHVFLEARYAPEAFRLSW